MSVQIGYPREQKNNRIIAGQLPLVYKFLDFFFGHGFTVTTWITMFEPVECRHTAT